jgi:hypothetical protein
MDAEANATTRNGRNGTAWTPRNVFLNRVPRFESWRGRVCAGHSVAGVTREARKHRCAKPMLDEMSRARQLNSAITARDVILPANDCWGVDYPVLL